MGGAPRFTEAEAKQLIEGQPAESERDVQRNLFRWAKATEASRPDLSLLHAIPNGQYRPGQAMEPGLKSGVPDICLPVVRGDCPGLYLELKTTDGRLRDEQEEWLLALTEQGYAAVVCYGFEAASETLLAYLDGYFDRSDPSSRIEGLTIPARE